MVTSVPNIKLTPSAQHDTVRVGDLVPNDPNIIHAKPTIKTDAYWFPLIPLR